jgi:hypothetical protein
MRYALAGSRRSLYGNREETPTCKCAFERGSRKGRRPRDSFGASAWVRRYCFEGLLGCSNVIIILQVVMKIAQS